MSRSALTNPLPPDVSPMRLFPRLVTVPSTSQSEIDVHSPACRSGAERQGNLCVKCRYAVGRQVPVGRLEPDVAQSGFDRSFGGSAASPLVGVLTELRERLTGAFHAREQARLGLTLPANVLGSFDLTERCVETDNGSSFVSLGLAAERGRLDERHVHQPHGRLATHGPLALDPGIASRPERHSASTDAARAMVNRRHFRSLEAACWMAASVMPSCSAIAA